MRRRHLAAAVAGLLPGSPHAQTQVSDRVPDRLSDRADTLRVLSEAGPNAFDPIALGANRNAIQVHWNTYDRLLRFGTRLLPDGTPVSDYFSIEGALAERFELTDGGRVITLHLREGVRFHDGAPVTAADVKWSLDRVVASPIGRAQFATGSMTAPEQFLVLDDRTVRITAQRPDRFTLPNLAGTFPVIINSEAARAHATPSDPFASGWLRSNVAGGGPYRLDGYTPGQSVAFSRFEDWACGVQPGFRRVLWQVAPAAQTRRALLERGDADLVQDLPPQDVAALSALPGLQVVGAPVPGAFQFIGMNTKAPPFDDVRVRQAVGYALPYQAMFEAALFARGRPLFGPVPGQAESAFPQPLGYVTDPARARALLVEAGHAHGFPATLTFELSLATVAEPAALLVQEALGRVGIRLQIEKVPAGQMGALLDRKSVPLFFEGSIAFFNDPDYFFRVFYDGPTRWNFGSYDNPEMAALVAQTRFETDAAQYAAQVQRMIALARRDVPILPLWQPSLDVGMLRTVSGYACQFHRQLDFRTLRRA